MGDYKIGQENLAKAISYTKTSVLSFRFSPEWESVQRHARRAIEAFKPCGAQAYDELLQSYDLGIEAFEHTGSYQQCGLYCDEAGELASRITETLDTKELKLPYWMKAIQYYQNAAKYFRLHGNQDKNVGILLKAAKCMNDAGQYKQGLELAKKACEVYETDHKLIGAEKYLTQVLQMIIASKQWLMVIDWLRYQVKILNKRRDMYANSIYHCYLGEIVVYLSLQQYDDALKSLLKYEEDDETFIRSEQYSGAKALINACNSDDIESLTKARKDWPILKYLERDIALLVPQIQLNPEYVGYNRQSDDDISDGEGGKIVSKPVKKDKFHDASDDIAGGML